MNYDTNYGIFILKTNSLFYNEELPLKFWVSTIRKKQQKYFEYIKCQCFKNQFGNHIGVN